MTKIKELYEIGRETLNVVIKELRKIMDKVSTKNVNQEFNIILEDMMESISASEQLINDYKINAGMTTLRNSFELIVTYVAVINNEQHRINYMDIKKKRNIKAFSQEISNKISKNIYDETYTFLCEFAHPTILRNYFCDVGKTENGMEINRCLGIFLVIMVVSEYITYLNILGKQEKNFELNSLLFMFFSAFLYSLNKYRIDNGIIQKYQILFGTEEERKKLADKSAEAKNFITENNDEILQKLTENMNSNKELKMKIIEYLSK